MNAALLESFQHSVNVNTITEQARIIRELESVLRAIVHEYDQTYDGDQSADGYWTGAASIPLSVMEKARRLCE